MSAYSYLIVHDDPTPLREKSAPKGSKLIGANYQVPILWLALFTQEDIQHISLPLDEWGDGVTPVIMPTLIARTSDALRKYAERRDRLRAKLPEQAEYFDEWEAFIGTYLKSEFVQLDFEDFFDSGFDDFDSSLRGWLDGIERLEGSGWDDLRDYATLQDPDSWNVDMRGFAWDADPDWED